MAGTRHCRRRFKIVSLRARCVDNNARHFACASRFVARIKREKTKNNPLVRCGRCSDNCCDFKNGNGRAFLVRRSGWRRDYRRFVLDCQGHCKK